MKKKIKEKKHIHFQKNNLRFLFNESVSKWNLILNTTRMIYKELRFMWFKTFVDCHCWPLVSKSFDSMWIQFFLWKKFCISTTNPINAYLNTKLEYGQFMWIHWFDVTKSHWFNPKIESILFTNEFFEKKGNSWIKK